MRRHGIRNVSQDKRTFSRTADMTHYRNSVNPMRGGIRL